MLGHQDRHPEQGLAPEQPLVEELGQDQAMISWGTVEMTQMLRVLRTEFQNRGSSWSSRW